MIRAGASHLVEVALRGFQLHQDPVKNSQAGDGEWWAGGTLRGKPMVNQPDCALYVHVSVCARRVRERQNCVSDWQEVCMSVHTHTHNLTHTCNLPFCPCDGQTPRHLRSSKVTFWLFSLSLSLGSILILAFDLTLILQQEGCVCACALVCMCVKRGVNWG